MALFSSFSSNETLAGRFDASLGGAVPERTRREKGEEGAMRRCLVSGEQRAKADLIRFVVGPENTLIPDIAEKLPGRGLWILADRATIDEAIRKNLFTKAARHKVKIEEGLTDKAASLLAKRCLDLLGLAKGAGCVVYGQPQVEAALGNGSLDTVLLAADAGRDVTKKLAHANLLKCALTRDQLGDALGRAQCVAAGLRSHPLSEKLKTEIKRWQGVKAPASDSSEAVPDSSNRACEEK
jgi:hypothetical protein